MPRTKVKRAVTQEDLDLNPELVEDGVIVGDIMKLPPLPEKDELEEEDDSDEQENETSSAQADAITKVTFQIRNPNVKTFTVDRNGKIVTLQGHPPVGYSERVFTEAEHGEDFLNLADEFQASNTWKKPVNMNDPVEVKACQDFNVNIKHPVISRTNE